MRTAGMIMGIVGGAIAILFGAFFIFGSAMFFSMGSWNSYMSDSYSQAQQASSITGGTVFLVIGIIIILTGVLGLVGGLIIKKKNVAAGVMMIVAAGLSLFSFFNIISMVLFILGGIFALMRDRSQIPTQPPYPYYPYPPYAPYPPAPYAQTHTTPPNFSAQPVSPEPNPPEQPQP